MAIQKVKVVPQAGTQLIVTTMQIECKKSRLKDHDTIVNQSS